MPDEPKKTSPGPLKKIAGFISERLNVQRSLSIAGKRQQLMLPRVPEVPGYEFACVYRPAEHVSGDFCDIVDLGEGRYGMLIGDVSGHGMEAGVVMGSARKALQLFAQTGEPPVAVLSWANEDLSRELDRETFLTAGYAVLDTGGHALRYVRAGHTHPLLIGPSAGQWQVVKSGGMMIGSALGERFTKSLVEVALELQPGQFFVQYTDGLVEATERGGDQFGIDRVIEHFDREASAPTPLAGVLDGLIQELSSWTGLSAQEDDVSVLAVRRKA